MNEERDFYAEIRDVVEDWAEVESFAEIGEQVQEIVANAEDNQ